MDIEFPLEYRVDCIPFKRRLRGSVSILQSVTLPVAEVSEADAPVAARIFMPDGGEMSLRWHGGRYWTEDRGSDPAVDELREFLTVGKGYYSGQKGVPAGESLFMFRNFSDYTLRQYRDGVRTTVEGVRCRDITGDNRDAMLARLRKAVSEGFLLIDGAAWTSVPEPFFVLDVEDGKRVAATVSLGTPKQDDVKAKRFVFALCQAEELNDLLAQAKAEGIPVSSDVMAERIGGETSPVDCRAQHVLQAARSVLSRDAYRLSGYDREKGNAWYDLRDVAKEAAAGEDEAAIDAVAGALEAYGAYGDIGTFARMAAERWKMRPMDFGAVFAS